MNDFERHISYLSAEILRHQLKGNFISILKSLLPEYSNQEPHLKRAYRLLVLQFYQIWTKQNPHTIPDLFWQIHRLPKYKPDDVQSLLLILNLINKTKKSDSEGDYETSLEYMRQINEILPSDGYWQRLQTWKLYHKDFSQVYEPLIYLTDFSKKHLLSRGINPDIFIQSKKLTKPVKDKTILFFSLKHAPSWSVPDILNLLYLIKDFQKENRLLFVVDNWLKALLKDNLDDFEEWNLTDEFDYYSTDPLEFLRAINFNPNTYKIPTNYIRVPAYDDIQITSDRFKVGITWHVGYKHIKEMQVEGLEPLFDLPCNFYSLWPSTESIQAAQRYSNLFDLSDKLTDFHKGAAVIGQMDLVITVDSSIPYLAGAIGKPCWTLLPKLSDWRWGIDGESSYWFPNMKLFRQTSDDWKPVISQVKDELEQLL